MVKQGQTQEQKQEEALDRAVEEAGLQEARLEGQVGLGVDIVEIERMKAILTRTPAFAKKVFSEEEQAYCFSKATPEIHFATRFAAKEAALKTLGIGFARGIGPRDVEVKRTERGKPYLVLFGNAKKEAEALGVLELPVSLSYTHQEAVACAMAITKESVRVQEERIDPMQELAQQFKEARSLLDEMEKDKTMNASEDAQPDNGKNVEADND